MNAEDSKDNEVVTTGDNGVNDNNNSNTLVAESPSEKNDINSAGTAEPAAKYNVPPESGENEEEKEMGNDQLKRKISFVLQKFDPYYGEKEEYTLFMPDGSSKQIMVNDTTTVWDLTERLDKYVGPRMMYVGLRRKQVRKNEYTGEYEYTGRIITGESTMPWSMKEVEKHKWAMVICFRSEKEWRDVTAPWKGVPGF